MKALVVENLTKKYLLKQALDQFSVTFERGTIVGLLGPNGSGKTTFMRIAAGLLQPTSGRIIVDNAKVGSGSKERIAFMPTESHLYDTMTIEQMIRFHNKFYKDYNVVKANQLVTTLTLNSKQRIKSLSTGQKGRLKVALTMCREADVYLFDEPLNGLDPISRDMILDMLAAQVDDKKCIVISSHLVSEFERICDTMVFIKDGRLEMIGATDDLRAKHSKSIHDLYKEVYHYA